jgi:hypothetical protein
LADNDPTPYKDSDELIKELELVVQGYHDVLKVYYYEKTKHAKNVVHFKNSCFSFSIFSQENFLWKRFD